MSNQVSFFDFRFALAKSDWFGHDLDKLIEAIVLSRAVPLFSGAFRIEHFVTPDTRVDVLRERVSIPIGRDPSPLGPLAPGLAQFKHFDHMQIDAAKALAWLRESFDVGTAPSITVEPQSRGGRPSKIGAAKERYGDDLLAIGTTQLAKEMDVSLSTAQRWKNPKTLRNPKRPKRAK